MQLKGGKITTPELIWIYQLGSTFELRKRRSLLPSLMKDCSCRLYAHFLQKSLFNPYREFANSLLRMGCDFELIKLIL